eukprot:g859.t1
MRKVVKLFRNCFQSTKVDCDSVGPLDETEVEATTATNAATNANSVATRRPPVFPSKRRIGTSPRADIRPHSPFETRLRRLGQKIEIEVSKEDCVSEGSRLRNSRVRTEGESGGSDGSWSYCRGVDLDGVLSSANSDREFNGVRKGESRKLAFSSIDSSEPESCTRLEEELIPSNNLWMYNSSSCASSASLRDLTQTQYLFYEEEDDVVMEFFPAVRVIQQAS